MANGHEGPPTNGGGDNSPGTNTPPPYPSILVEDQIALPQSARKATVEHSSVHYRGRGSLPRARPETEQQQPAKGPSSAPPSVDPAQPRGGQATRGGATHARPVEQHRWKEPAAAEAEYPVRSQRPGKCASPLASPQPSQHVQGFSYGCEVGRPSVAPANSSGGFPAHAPPAVGPAIGSPISGSSGSGSDSSRSPALGASGVTVKMSLKVSAKGLDKKDRFFGKSDPYFKFERLHGFKSSESSENVLHRSEVKIRNLNPSWNAFVVEFESTIDVYDEMFSFTVMDKDWAKSDDEVGRTFVTLRDLQGQPNLKLVHSKNRASGKSSGILVIDSCIMNFVDPSKRMQWSG